ncbi:TPA: hypothetical protein N0F65_011773 [Lagenidium giganteum]|uniref:HTH CENPB-type domain-containing protein n=1 Tax=Lagenidium giganteum TaxID=4803 RepID=A0AAV2YF86_9STRA|nr:TPA: hypothetical protein N0F65_011773 [Lagenidium giganteum]
MAAENRARTSTRRQLTSIVWAWSSTLSAMVSRTRWRISFFLTILVPCWTRSAKPCTIERRIKPTLLRSAHPAAEEARRRSRPPATGTSLSPALQESLLRWINDYRKDGAPVSSTMLRVRAIRVAEDAGIPKGFFKATHTWQQGFLRRNKLAFRSKTRQGQIAPSDAAAVASQFREELAAKMHELDVDSTIDKKGTKTVWVRSSERDKERLTCMVMGNSHGAKCTPLLMLKTSRSKNAATAKLNDDKRHGFGVRLWKEIEALQRVQGSDLRQRHRLMERWSLHRISPIPF